MHRAWILAALLATPITTFATSLAGSPARRLRGAQEEVHLQTSDHVELAGTYFEPRRGRSPAVLLVHDAGSSRSSMVGLAERLQRAGFGVLTIDLRGHGESRTDKLDWTTLDESSRASQWQLALRDVAAAADWLLSQKEIHSTSLSVVGHRAGSALVARHAESDENVVSMTLLSPKSQDFGFDVEGAIHNLNGLPTCVLSERDAETERMVSEANAITATPWIDYMPMVTKKTTILDDSKALSKVVKWVGGVALPKKGR